MERQELTDIGNDANGLGKQWTAGDEVPCGKISDAQR